MPIETGRDAGPDASTSGEQTASALNQAGLDAHREKRYPAAISRYEKALEVYPDHVFARYNLSCAFALVGEREKAIASLRQLEKSGCTACMAQLARARRDDDLASLWSDKDFIAATRGPGATSAAKALDEAFKRGRFDLVRGYVADGKVSGTWHCSVCDPGDDKETKAYTPRDLEKMIGRVHKNDRSMQRGGDGPSYEGFEGMSCKGDCCRAERESISHNTVFLDQVCVTRDKRGAVTIKSFEFIDGG